MALDGFLILWQDKHLQNMTVVQHYTMVRREFLKSTLGLAGTVLTDTCAWAAPDTKKRRHPNVLFIAVDDMNDWTAGLGGYAGKVYTPNQQRLAKMGVAFVNAHTASPVCCPSRGAVMTGLRPSTSGIYNNGQWWKPHMPGVKTIPQYFKENGYYAAGVGKIHHHTWGSNPPCQWDEYKRMQFDNEWDLPNRLNYPWNENRPPVPKKYPFNGLASARHEFDWGVLDKPEDQFGDAVSVTWAIDFLKRKHTKPFFLACGTFRPHLPWYIPKQYLEMYPLDEIELPTIRPGDLDDIPAEGKKLAKARRGDFERIAAAGKWKEAIQAYLASITFADAQVGRLLDAIGASPYAENTVIVFWSDHGWHLGEKNHWHKMTLWEEGTRVPFYLAGPGIRRGGNCPRPVGLVDIYPTLIELCGLAEKPELDGTSLVPLLENPFAEWSRPAITEFHPGQCAVRSQHWRYIRYQDGTEELYDHRIDPNEWHNLAGDKQYTEVKRRHAQWIPKHIAPAAPSKGAYEVDWQAYTWKNRKTGKTVDGKNDSR
jgi:arylsulfatase A-like enzyme